MKRVHGGTIDRVAWRVVASVDTVDWVQRKVTKSIRRWTQMGRSRNPGTGTAVGCRLTAERDRRNLVVFAMSPKPHSYRWLHDEIPPRTGSWPPSSNAGGDQHGLNLRSATWSNDAENQLTSPTVLGFHEVVGQANPGATVTANTLSTYRRGEYFRMEITAANASAPVYGANTVSAQWGAPGYLSNRFGRRRKGLLQ